MVHYPDDDTAHLDSLKLEAFEPQQPKMTITADRGRLERTGDRVWIEGHVVLVREGDARMEPARVTTDRLLVLPDEGIAPGTRWEDVPMNWTCPECGARKEDFEMVEI